MDRALRISWYDLPVTGREAYLDWLHGVHIPALLALPGLRWAAHYASVEKAGMVPTHPEFVTPVTGDHTVPEGDRYILLIGGEDANVFGAPAPAATLAGLTAADRAMLALRQGERVNIAVEAARVDGPAGPGYRGGMALAPCIQIGSYNCDYRDEEELLAWYAQWRMAAMRTLPGCIRTRMLASVAGWAKHAIIYEFESVEVRNRHYPGHEAERPDMKAWSERIVKKLVHAPGSANLATRLWPPVAG